MKPSALHCPAGVVFAALLALAVPAITAAEAVLPWGDQGDGTYRNPILPADYSDPDVIRVGDDFYLVASEFHFMGIQVLHSRDLVNWRIIGRVFDRLTIDPKYDAMQGYAQGTWAPSLRYHNGMFYLYVCTPRDGLQRWTARDPAGPWEHVTVKQVDQWEDPCPFWDDDGQAYLVHSKLGAGPLILHKLSQDGAQLLDDGVEIYRGPVAEGPKLFKRGGWYYISLPEGGVERGGQTVLRSRELYGPYERRVVTPDGAPHQGGLVELDNGEAWFIGFKSAGQLGRVPMLQPVKWGVDGWPVFGDAGRPVLAGKKPAVGAGTPISHPQTSDEFDSSAPGLQPQWQWNHNPVDNAWSLTARPGWLRLNGRPAENLEFARNTLTQKLWGQSGTCDVKVETSALADGQRAGLTFMSGKVFNAVGVERSAGVSRIFWDGARGPALTGSTVWLRGEYHGDAARLLYSLDGVTFADTGLQVTLKYSQWKGARVALFCYGAGGGAADFDYYRFTPGKDPVPVLLPDATPIDREALVRRHNPVFRKLDYSAPLTVGNGGFAMTVDITGLQTFGEPYYRNGIPLETMARWCWATDENPSGYKLTDANQEYVQADGTTVALPSKLGTPASDWLRRNPRQHPLAQVALEWSDGTALKPEDIQEPEQTLDLWSGVISSRYKLGGVPVTVVTACDPATDTLAVRITSSLVEKGKLRARLRFPRGHDPAVKNTPALDWSESPGHETKQATLAYVEERTGAAAYRAGVEFSWAPRVHASNEMAGRLTQVGAHEFALRGDGGWDELGFTVRFAPLDSDRSRLKEPQDVFVATATHWAEFWRSGAAVDFTGSTNPLASKLEERIILSRYLTAAQCVGAMPPQESGLTCNTWYGKHHTEMLLWHTAHFVLWGEPEMAKKNLDWFLGQLPAARATAAARGLKGARWSKMVGPDGRESPSGNPLIVWNQPHPIYLANLILRQSPKAGNLEKYLPLVQETAECLVSMLKFDAKRGQYVLGPPLWIAQEIHDPATSQNPAYELAYWRWAIETAQRWRVRAGQTRDSHWDDVLAKLAPLPVVDGKYTALESHPDTWTNLASRHDHPEMLMAMGFFPPGTDVDVATMDRTLTGVLEQWDWATKIWGWDYPMVAMAATRLGRPADAIEISDAGGTQ